MVKAYLNYELSTSSSATSTTLLPNNPILTINNRRCVLVAADERAQAVCLRTGEVLLTVAQDAESKLALVTGGGLTPAGDKLLLGFSNGDLLLRDLNAQSQEEDRRLASGKKAVVALSALSSGAFELAAVGFADNAVLVFDLAMGEVLFELKGHQTPIVAALSAAGGKRLLTLGSDGIVRLWDLSSGVLLEIVATNKSEITAGLLLDIELAEGKSVSCLVLATNDEEILIYHLKEDGGFVDKEKPEVFKRDNYYKIVQMSLFENYLVALTENSNFESYTILSSSEVSKKYKRKVKREVKDLPSLEEYLTKVSSYLLFKFSAKVPEGNKRFCVFRHKDKTKVENYLLLFSTKNAFERHSIDFEAGTLKIARNYDNFGHMNPINFALFSSDDFYLVSASSDCICYWEAESSRLIARLPITNASCAAFLPKDRFLVIGTKTGHLILFDLFNKQTSFSVDLSTEGQNANTLEKTKGSRPAISVNDILLFDFSFNGRVELGVLASNNTLSIYTLTAKGSSAALALKRERVQRLQDEPTTLKFVPVSKQIMISFLDNSVRIFHGENFKEHLALYGHSLPVADFDISTDGYVVATISQDKSIRIWDRDFGNCRRIINKAHENGVFRIKMLRDTHYALSSGRDGLVKFWDLDTFESVMVFENLLGGAVRALALSSIGDFFVAGGANRSLRKYTQTNDQVFAEETKERLQEDQLMMEEFKENEKGEEKDLAMKRYENLKTAEEFMDYIDEIEKDAGEEQRGYESDLLIGKKRARPDFSSTKGKSPAEAVLEKLDKIPKGALDSVLNFIHLRHIENLLFYVSFALKNKIFENLCFNLTKFIVEKHEGSLVQNQTTLQVLQKVVRELLKGVQANHKLANFNHAALSLNLRELKLLY